MTDTHTAAMAWHDAGASVVRVNADGTKAPLGTWKEYQEHRATKGQIDAWFAGGHPGLGVITGAVSGDLEMLEFEGRAITENLLTAWVTLLREHSLGDLADRVLSGCVIGSPSGGLHLYYRVTGGVDANTKLAQREARDDELTDDEQALLDTKGRRARRTLIETRGEGGFVVTAPSNGPVHPSGKPWTVGSGGPATIPTITADERDELHAFAASLDQTPAPAPARDPVLLEPRDRTGTGLAPGDDFNARGSWDDILDPAGWTLVRRVGTKTYWRRPGKPIGISAVTGGDQGDYFWCWSTSTELPDSEALSKWRVYAFLIHGGDWKAAARALRKDGYGEKPPPPTRPVLTPLPTTTAPATGDSTAPATADGATAPQPDAPPRAITVTLARSEDGNALALVDTYHDRIRYCADRGRWLNWTGQHWQWCPPGGGIIREYAKTLARHLPETFEADLSHKKSSLKSAGISAMVNLATTDPRITVNLDQLDTRPQEINTPSGIINLTTGELTGHDPAALHTKITAVAPDATADTNRWETFLTDTFGDDHELIHYVQRLLGYSASGEVRDHILPFAFGSGGNGKGVLLETTLGVLGDYATTAPNKFLMAQTYTGHETEIARLTGKRLVVCSEVNDGDRFDEAKVKQLTGGDTLTARFMNQDHFTFRPSHKLWLLGNSQPDVASGGGPSFWRRLRLLPFLRTVPDDKRVDDLQDVLVRDHGPAILAWIIRGAVDYYHAGLRTPAAVLAATADYAATEDNLARFIDAECHLAPTNPNSVRVTKKALRDRYLAWCKQENEEPVGAKRFGMDLRSRFGVTAAKSRNPQTYEGITLHADPDEQGWQPE